MSVLSSIKSFFSPLPKKKVDFRPSVFRDKDIQFIEDIPPVPSTLQSAVGISSKYTLQDAVNDAKTVRQTALKNAQHALASAFDLHGIKPSNPIYKPGYKITILEENEAIGDFDEDLDFSMGLSGFQLNVPNLNNNQYNSITLTGSIPAPTSQYIPSNHASINSMMNSIPPVVSMSDPLPKPDEFLDDLLQQQKGLPQPSGAVDEQPKTPDRKIARVEFDVVIGRPQWSNQIHAIKNSIGKEIYLASNQGIIRAAIKTFNEKLKEMYGDKTPVFTIENGTMFRTGLVDEPHPILDFHGLRFPLNGAKIVAIFSYSDKNTGNKDIEAVKKDLELIGNTCQFFVLGELELTEDEESITDIVIESFGYNNPHRMNVNKELFRIL